MNKYFLYPTSVLSGILGNMALLRLKFFPFYGTQFENNVANIGKLPIPCEVEKSRDELVHSISFMVASLRPILKCHSDYQISSDEYFAHLSVQVDHLAEVLKLPQINYKQLFDDIWETSYQKNQIYMKHGLPYESSEISERVVEMERVLAVPSEKLTDSQIVSFYSNYCDFILTFSTTFLVTKCLPML